MALSDWVFDSRTDPQASVEFDIRVDTPGVIGGNSLRCTAQDDFATAVIAGRLDPLTHTTGLAAGLLECTFLKRPGTDQREQGLFCLTSLADPTASMARGYVVQMNDGAQGQIRVYKMTNGLFDFPTMTLLRAYAIPGFLNTENQAISLRLKWFAGLFATNTNTVRLQLWYGINTAGDVPQALTPDTLDTTALLYTGVSEGFFARTRSATQLLDSYFDNLRVARIPVQQGV